MSVIKVLSEDLIGKIAAGEVVERPASVVKELVENSVDAGAKEVIIDIEDGGKKRLIVIDDGCGMSAEDARLSVQRHATSKISTDSDLNSIKTMGFRGEALPSIAAVSRLTIETKAPSPYPSPSRGEGKGEGDLAGYKIVILGGDIIESGDFGCADGTRIVVEDLFFNTPARKKFLRGDKTEEGHIIDVVGRIAISFPQVRFKLIADGKEKLSCYSVDDPKARLLEVFGGDVAALSKPFSERGNGIEISGFLGEPDTANMFAQGTYLFVNKRYVKDRVLNHAVSDGYRNLLPKGRYPFAVIMLDIDPSRVDVNVHPTKQEVRFDNSGAIHSFVASAIKKTISATEFPLPRGERARERVAIESIGSIPMTGVIQPQFYEKVTEDVKASASTPIFIPQREHLQYQLTDISSHYETYRFSSLKVIGQLANSFIICEGENGEMVVVDQHAAHERIGFEILKGQLAKEKIEQQQLLIPEQIELHPKDAGYISENLEILNKVGIEIEPFGGNTFIIKALPALLADSDMKGLIVKLAHDLSEIGNSSQTEEVTENILKTMACHRQVRFGHSLALDEMRHLLNEMDKWPNTDRCPHGRPSFIKLGNTEIKKWFERM